MPRNRVRIGIEKTGLAHGHRPSAAPARARAACRSTLPFGSMRQRVDGDERRAAPRRAGSTQSRSSRERRARDVAGPTTATTALAPLGVGYADHRRARARRGAARSRADGRGRAR